MVRQLLKYHLYIVGLAVVVVVSYLLNRDCPPNYDEAHTWNIARYLSPAEIFVISKTEGHPFLWYYLLMPLAKTNFLYPYSLYALNLVLMLGAFFLLYKYAPFPSYVKYLITFSAPFLQLYPSFARSYSLMILLLFALLALYPKRQNHLLLYMLLLLLLANTCLFGLFAAFPLGVMYLLENAGTAVATDSQRKNRIGIILNFALLELVLLLAQFYGYDRNIPNHTPKFNSLAEDLNAALFPLNIQIFALFSAGFCLLFLKTGRPRAVFFFLFTAGCMTVLFNFIYHGALHHYYFFYVFAVASFWLAGKEKNEPLPKMSVRLLALMTFLLIFNPNTHYKKNDRDYLQNIRQSALEINRLFPRKPVEIYVYDGFNADIIRPYLNENIILLNQTFTRTETLKAFQETLYFFYMKINPYTLADHLKENPDTLLYRSCGEHAYYHANLAFRKRTVLTPQYCLYAIEEQ